MSHFRKPSPRIAAGLRVGMTHALYGCVRRAPFPLRRSEVTMRAKIKLDNARTWIDLSEHSNADLCIRATYEVLTECEQETREKYGHGHKFTRRIEGERQVYVRALEALKCGSDVLAAEWLGSAIGQDFDLEREHTSESERFYAEGWNDAAEDLRDTLRMCTEGHEYTGA